MQELEKRIGLLRLLLADITGKYAQLAEMEKQYRAQLTRIVDFVVYREGDVANALSLMAEVQGKLDEVLHTTAHLELISQKANKELEVLLLTKRVADARSQLVTLQERQQELANRLAHFAGESIEHAESEDAAEIEDIRSIHDEVERDIARLNDLITEASERAARTVQSHAERSARQGAS